MKCDVCRGACCEEFFIPDAGARDDASRWFGLHGEGDTIPGYLRFECRCSQLTDEGACGIHEDRPDICRNFKAGSQMCVDTVLRRRGVAQYREIRDEGDPKH